ncbi:MAG: tetratricopeptide repeat protein [bacterium]
MWKKMLLLCLILFEMCLLSGTCLCQELPEMRMGETLITTEDRLKGSGISDQVSITVQGLTEPQTTNPAFADYLFSQGDYYRAAGEYQRVIFTATRGTTSNQNKEHIQKAMFRIGLCYQKSKQWDTALTYFEGLLKQQLYGRKAATLITDAIKFEIGMTHYLKGTYPQAIKIFQCLLDSDKLSDYSRYMLGWCYLKQMDWTKAGDEFGRISPDSSIYTFSQELAEFAKNGDKLQHKSSLIAGMMSMLFPGTGQMYLHRFGDGTFSMLLTLGTTWLGHHYSQQGDKAAGNILSGLGCIFYGGNIYGAAASAKLLNASCQANYLEQITELDRERGIIIECWK